MDSQGRDERRERVNQSTSPTSYQKRILARGTKTLAVGGWTNGSSRPLSQKNAARRDPS